MHSVESLFKCTMNLDSNALRVPHEVELQFVTHPEMILSCLDHFADIPDNKFENKKKQIYLLFNEGFTRLRYKLDNQDAHAQNLLDQLHQMLKQMFQSLTDDKKMLINDALHESKLPTPELDHHDAIQSATLDQIPNIAPQLPAFLDRMRRESGIKTSFELYTFLIAQMQLQPIKIQCALIDELITTQKEFIHDVGVLMLLHPKKSIRCMVPLIWARNFSENTIKISSTTLRRFIVIRNWLPHDEQQSLDELIQQVRRKGVMSAPYPASKVTKLVSSMVDGAGVQCIMFETKTKNQRTIAGFLLKEGIGIREPFIMHKAHPEEFTNILEQQHTLLSKSVSTAFVSKLVSHFIAVGQKNNNIPEPAFLEIAELFGSQNWLPQMINPMDEIIRIKEQEQLNTSNLALIDLSLKTSGQWQEEFGQSWFETGDRVHQAMMEATETHAKQKNKSNPPLSTVAAKVLLRGELLDKWIFIMIRMLLWYRSKSIKGDNWKHFLVIAELLLQGYPVENIPLIEHITERSFAHTMQYHGHMYR